MLTCKRVIIATLCGIASGFVCLALATSNPDSAANMSMAIKANIVLSRTLTGFMIGISAVRIRWWLHGILMGILGSIPMALGAMGSAAPSGEMTPAMIVVSTVVMGIIYGVLIELVTTILFKAKPAWKAA
jgi:hypothetical protein